MDDLIKRLRMYEDSDRASTEHEAADEIERLRAVNEDAEQRLFNMDKVVQANIESGRRIRIELNTVTCDLKYSKRMTERYFDELKTAEKRIEFLEASAKAVATHGRTFP